MLFRNFFSLYKRKCDATWKQILSAYHDDVTFPVFAMNEWRGDSWDAFDYGVDINLDQDIFSQIKKLHNTVPRINIMNIDCENTEYCNMSANSKNCYLVWWNIFNEDCYYGHIVWRSKNCFDCLYLYDCELCYQCVDCIESYKIHFGIDVENCSESSFLINCKWCKSCFWCVGLNNKEYCIYNDQYTKEEYLSKIKELKPKTQKDIDIIWKKLEELKPDQVVKFFHGYNYEDVTWDYIYHSKNIHNSYDIKKSENLKYCTTLESFTNSYDCNYSGKSCDLSYNCMSTYWYHNIFCHNCLSESQNMIYCDNCYYSNNCFACVWLKNQEYCIFNKQYTKEEYEKLVPQLIDKMISDNQRWEFFPENVSSFAYNESIVSEYYPLKKNEAVSKWYNRRDKAITQYDWPVYKAKTIDHYLDKQTQQEVLSGILQCESSWKPYRIIRKELEFLTKMWLPLPNKHPDIRHQERMNLRNPRKLRDRKCDNCNIDLKTTYSPNTKEKVYCDKCYDKRS